MAMIYIDGIEKPVPVQDAPEFEEAVAMISALEEGSMVVFPTAESDIAVAKSRLIMFVQGKAKATRKQFVMPVAETEDKGTPLGRGVVPPGEYIATKKKKRKKRARSKGVQKENSE